MTGLEWLFLGAFLAVLALLAVATVANQDLAAENRRLRARIHPSTRKAQQ